MLKTAMRNEMIQPSLTKDKKYAGQFMGLIYASLIAVSTLKGHFHLVEIPWFVTQFAYAGIIFIGLVWIFITGNTSRLNTSVNVMAFQMIPQIIILVWSVTIWVYKKEPLANILRGSSLVLYQLLLLAMLIAPGAMFGKKALEYTAQGFILANTLVLLDTMRRLGVGATISGFVQFMMSAGTKDNIVSMNLEVQDLTFGIGILLVYYLVDGKNEHWRKFYILALGFYFITGFKRILFPALAAGLFYFLVINKLGKKIQIRTSVLIGITLIAISIGYVILIKSGFVFEIADRFGVNLMGRKRLWGHVQSYYSISPVYMGIGFGRVSKVLEVAEVTGNRRLHCDVLRLYIELGMPVFIIWCLITYVITYTFLNKTYSLRSARIYFAITVLMFVTFMTDNTIEKYCPQIAWHVLPLAVVLADKEAFADSLKKRSFLSNDGKQKI